MNTIPTQNVYIKGLARFGGLTEVTGDVEFSQDYVLNTVNPEHDITVHTDQAVSVTWYPNIHTFKQFMPLILRLDPGVASDTGVLYCADYPDGEPAKGSKTATTSYMVVGCVPVDAFVGTQQFDINEHVIDMAFNDLTLVSISSSLVGFDHIIDLTPMFSYAQGVENLSISGLDVDGTGMVWADVLISTISPAPAAQYGVGTQTVLNESSPLGKLTMTPYDKVGDYWTNRYRVVNTGTVKDVTLKIRAVRSGI